MRMVTIVSLGASAVLGIAALVVAKTVLPNQAAAAKSTVQVTAGTPIVVASTAMKYGDKVDAQHLKIIQVPANAVPEGAFTTVAAVLSADHGGAPVVLTPIAVREPILPAKLSGPGARPSVAAEIKDGMRAYTIKVTDVSGVGGHALPGDRVDVVLLRDLTPQSPQRSWVSQVVLQDVRVLAIDLNADQAADKPATPNNATLEVSVEDSQKLAIAADLGKLSLALRRTGSAEVTDTGLMRTSAFAGGGPVAAPSMGGAPARPRAPARAAWGGYSSPILIIEGDRRGNRQSAPSPMAPPPAAPVAAAPAVPAAASASIG
jgi:pilus assembly protein CpaB